MPQLRIYDVCLLEYVHLSENSMYPYSVHLSADLSRLVGTHAPTHPTTRFWTSGELIVYHLNKTTSRTEYSVKSTEYPYRHQKASPHLCIIYILHSPLKLSDSLSVRKSLFKLQFFFPLFLPKACR